MSACEAINVCLPSKTASDPQKGIAICEMADGNVIRSVRGARRLYGGF